MRLMRRLRTWPTPNQLMVHADQVSMFEGQSVSNSCSNSPEHQTQIPITMIWNMVDSLISVDIDCETTYVLWFDRFDVCL